MSQENVKLIHEYLLHRKRPRFNGISRFSAKKGKTLAKSMRRNGKKVLVISTDAQPWRF